MLLASMPLDFLTLLKGVFVDRGDMLVLSFRRLPRLDRAVFIPHIQSAPLNPRSARGEGRLHAGSVYPKCCGGWKVKFCRVVRPDRPRTAARGSHFLIDKASALLRDQKVSATASTVP